MTLAKTDWAPNEQVNNVKLNALGVAINERSDRANHTGTQSADTVVDGATNHVFTAADDAKLAGVAPNATANAADAALRDRATHTGQQTSTTISDFTEAVQDAVAALLQQGAGVTLSYDDAANSLTITGTAGGGGLDAEAVRDAIGVALIGTGLISVVPNDAADTITITTTATQNSTDAALRDRATHTGTQPADSITETAGLKVMTAAERTKLGGVAAGATVNDTDANLKNRANHTGAQAIGTVTGLQGALDGKAPVPTGTPNGTKFYRDDGTWAAVPAGGGGSASTFYMGDGAATSFTLNHGFGTRAVNVVVRRKSNGQRVYVDDYVLTLNSVKVEPSAGVIWALDEMIAYVTGSPGADDVTAPTAPTVAASNIQTTQVDATATGSTDAVGVVGYRWWLNGVFVAQTAGNTFTFTGLNGSTTYTLGCTTIDRAGNESALGTTPATTAAPANAAFVSSGAGARSDTNVPSISWAHTVPAGSNRYLLVAVFVSHLAGQWDQPSSYNVRSASSSLDGALTYLGAAANGVGGQWNGSVLFFGKANPTIGAHTVTVSISTQGNNQALKGNSHLYTGVGSVDNGAGTANAVVVYMPDSQGVLAVAVPAVAVGSMAVGAGVFDLAPTPTNLGRTGRYSDGGTIGGSGDFGAVADAAGAGATINFTTTSNGHYRAGVGLRLIKA